MNVSLQHIDSVSALLTVQVAKADYQATVDQSLKKFRQKAQIPGFRAGMVPMSLVKKMYSKSIIAEEIDKLLSNTVYGYIKENDLHVLGSPMPNEDKQPVVDFDTMEEFEFLFDIALAPAVKLELTMADSVDYYDIDVTDEKVQNQIKMYTQGRGTHTQVGTYQDKDMLKGLLAELDENGNTKEGGILVEEAVLMPSYIKDDAQKTRFNNARVNDVLVFNPHTAYQGHAAEISSLLAIDKEVASNVQSDFSYQITEILRYVDQELTQELFDQICGEGVVTTEEEFRAKVRGNISEQYVADSNIKFLMDLRKVAVDKVGELSFADTLLKRILLANNPEGGEAFVAEHYQKSIEELTWQLIKEELVAANNIKIEQQDIINAAREAIKAQFAQYGMYNLTTEMLDEYAKGMLKKQDSISQLTTKAIEDKLAAAIKEKVKLNRKPISVEDFNKMFE